MANSSRPPDPWPTIGRLALALLATGILTAGLLLPYVGGLGLAARHEAAKFLDTTCNLSETQPPQKTTLYARDGKTVLATLFTQDRRPVALKDVPQSLQDALVATEDRRFYSHHGVDMRGLIRSAVSTSSGDTQGGSTLTMQYVKQIRYYQAGKDLAKQQAAVDQNLNRKIEDAKCAIAIEKRESKQTILDNYLNIAFFGENSYGIETAAETYFNKRTTKLTLPESALLVGLLRAPTEYDPFVNPEAAKKRRNQVLQNLVDVHKLSQTQADTFKATPVKLATTRPPVVREGCANANPALKNAAFFCDYAVDWLENVNKVSETLLTTGGLKIKTTIDLALQNSVQTHLAGTIPATSPMTAVMPIVDPRTGDVLAMATSKQYGAKTSSRDVTHTSLPIFTEYSGMGASTYKLFPLLAALQTGVPSNWPLLTPSNTTGYVPSNCTTDAKITNADSIESFSRNETLATATAKSSNTYFVGLVDQLLGCDLQPVVDMARKLGMQGLNQPSGDGNQTIAQTIVNYQRPGELVLGDVGTSPLELAGAYAAVANSGRFNAPSPILSIEETVNGQPRQIPVKRSEEVQVVSPQVALQAVQILKGDTRFPGTSASQFSSWYGQNSSAIAGKTGTSVAVVNGKDTDANASVWFVGMTPDLVATTALINFDHPNAPASGLPNLYDPAHQAYG
ncbi:MAG TPA: transglycosylase domain-containing protein, partial [Jatrophihabitantaceae bacterium]|nr:transglycosylase domain-containing protein [Jatrophihabitantaceae bacterium]